MLPDDPRHGTSRGYVLGCREECCRRAQMIYMKRYRMGQTPSFTDPTGSHRRLRALAALGHSSRAIAAAAGHQTEWARSVLVSTRITTTTAAKVAAAYEQLCMTVPEGHLADRTRRESSAKGWLPPLAWDEDTIDDPKFTPRRAEASSRHDIDPIVIERILAGDTYLHTTVAEKHEAMRRWKAMGRSERSLCELTGWKESRYGRDEDVA